MGFVATITIRLVFALTATGRRWIFGSTATEWNSDGKKMGLGVNGNGKMDVQVNDNEKQI